jgi:hypothetical protein
VDNLWFSSSPPEHLAVFDGYIMASDSFGCQQGIKAYNNRTQSWRTIPRGYPGGTIVGLVKVGCDLVSVSWESIPQAELEVEGAHQNAEEPTLGFDFSPSFLYRIASYSMDVLRCGDCNLGRAGAHTAVESDLHILQMRGLGYALSSTQSEVNWAARVRCPSRPSKTVTSFVSTVKLELQICEAISL